MFSLKATIRTLGAAGVLAVALSFAVSFVGGRSSERAVEREVVANMVTADILPPPMYLVELRLVLSMAVDGSMPAAQAAAERDRLAKEYAERADHYRANPPYGLEASLLGAQHASALALIEASDAVLKAVAAGQAEAARELLAKAHVRYLEHRRGVDATVKTASAFAQEASNERVAAMRAQYLAQLAVLALAACGVAAMCAWALRTTFRATGGEPAEVARIANAVAQGDLSVRVPTRPGDRTSVMAAMAHMRERLAGVVSTIRESGDGVATGSREIAAGNSDLSVRTERQAANLQQTASAIEQFSGAVQHTADTAAQALKLSQQASEVAARGAEMVTEVVGTMGEISASSSRIRDITSVIDGIAFQTNILALNAAVEAARAGEHGRGFAVVASEVRQLAQRSASAAKEIHALIAASHDKVEAGVQRAEGTGQTMRDVVGQVRRVNDLIGEISVATREQTQGIGAVSTAITELDGATQQNAALVEQAAAASVSLNRCAADLVAVIGTFKPGSASPAQG